MPVWKEQGKEGAQKRWTDEVEENLKEMGIRLLPRVARDQMEWRRSVLEAKVHNRLYCLSMRLYQLMYHKYDLVVISIYIGAGNSLQLKTSNPLQ
jgi:hypothetical protein